MRAFLKSFLCTSLIASAFCGALIFAQTAMADEDPGAGTSLYCVGSGWTCSPIPLKTCPSAKVCDWVDLPGSWTSTCDCK